MVITWDDVMVVVADPVCDEVAVLETDVEAVVDAELEAVCTNQVHSPSKNANKKWKKTKSGTQKTKRREKKELEFLVIKRTINQCSTIYISGAHTRTYT